MSNEQRTQEQLEQTIDQIIAGEKEVYTHPNWTLPEEHYGDMSKAVEAEWQAIKAEQPELQLDQLHRNIARIYDKSFSDSEIRQALFHRMCDHYGVEYSVLYDTWLEGGCDVRTGELQKRTIS